MADPADLGQPHRVEPGAHQRRCWGKGDREGVQLGFLIPWTRVARRHLHLGVQATIFAPPGTSTSGGKNI